MGVRVRRAVGVRVHVFVALREVQPHAVAMRRPRSARMVAAGHAGHNT